MGIIAAGQITVVDLSDAPVLNAFITASRPTTQTYSKDSRNYNPSYASTPQVLTLNVTKSGSTTNIINSISGLHWFVVDGSVKTEITSKVNTSNEYISGAYNENLTTKLNIDTNKGYRRYEATGVWRDPSTDLDVQFSANINLLLTQNGATGPQGPQGDKGETGNGIANTVVTYGLSMSDTTEPATWSSDRPALVKGMYLWIRTVIIYTNGESTTSYQIGYIPQDADASAAIDKTKQELLEKLETVRDDSLEAVEEAKQQLATVRDESLAAAEEAKQGLINVNTKVDNAKEELTQAKQQLTTVADDLSQAKADLQNAVSAVDTKATNLKSDLTQAKQDLASQAQQLQEQAGAQSELTSRVSSVEKTANGTKTSVSELSKTVAQNGKDITSVTARTKVVEDDLAGTKTTLSQVKTTANSASQKTATLESGLNGLSAKFETLKIGSRNYFKNSKSRKYYIDDRETQDVRTVIDDKFWQNDTRFTKDYVRMSFDIAFNPALPSNFTTNVHFSASPWYNCGGITFKGGTTALQHFDLKFNLSGAGNDYKSGNIFIRLNNTLPLNTAVSLENFNLYLSAVVEDYSQNEADLEQKVAEYKQNADQNYASLQTTVQNLDGTVQHNKTVADQTAQGFSTRIESLETYKDGETTRANQYFESARTETARQLTAERTVIARDYVAKSTYTSDVTGIRNDLSATTSTANTIKTNLANYQASNDRAVANLQSNLQTANGNISSLKTKVEAVPGQITSAVSAVEGKIPTSAGGRNLALGTSGDWSGDWTNFNGQNNQTRTIYRIYNRGLKVGDKVNIRFVLKYRDIVATDGQTAKISSQFPGNVTAWGRGGLNGGQAVYPSPDDNEVVLSGTTTITNDHLRNDYWEWGLRVDYVASGRIQWKEAKAEAGDLPTPWSPAPEDTAEQISNLSSQIKQTADGITLLATKTELNTAKSELQSGINTATNKANSAQSTANNNAQTISTHTTQISALNTGLQAKVSQTDFNTLSGRVTTAENNITAKANELSSKISSVESKIPTSIGGRNLYALSKNSPLSSYDIGDLKQDLKTGEISFKVTSRDPFFGAQAMKDEAVGTRRGVKIPVKTGQGIAVWLTNPLFIKNFVSYFGNDDRAIKNYKNYQTNKFVIPASELGGVSYVTFRFGLVEDTQAVGSVHSTKVKVEYGNVYTDWSPAPEDTTEQISSLSSELKQTADGITLLATKTELNNAKTELQSGINTATNKANSNAQTINTHTTQISALNTGLQAKVSQTDFNTLSGRVTTAENNITAKANELSSKITSVEGKIPSGEMNLVEYGRPVDGYNRYAGAEYATHPFYYNGAYKMYIIKNSTTSEKLLGMNRFKVERNTEYTLYFKGFNNSAITHMDVWFLKRVNGSKNDYDSAQQLVSGRKLSNGFAENISVTFNTGNYDEGYLRFDNNGIANAGTQADLYFGDVSVKKGKTNNGWSPSLVELASSQDLKSTQSELKQTKDGITLLATKTELNTAKNELQSGINTASNKANAAQNTANSAQNKANSNAQTISTHTTQISALNTGLQAKVSQSDFNTLSGRVTSAENNITAKANELSSKITSVEGKIPTEIGSSNLLRKTAVNTENLKLFSKADTTVSVVGKDGHQVYKLVVSGSNNAGAYFTSNDNYYNLVKDRNYTFSFWVLTNKDKNYNMNSLGHIQAVNNNSDKVGNDSLHQHTSPVYSTNTIKANTWTKVWCTFKATSNSFFRPYFWYLKAGDEIYIYDMMLNEGKVPLSYTPAPEDTISQISSLSSELKQTKDGITLLATKTELNTAKNDLQSGITTATNKANAAQNTANSAQSTANSAQNKANSNAQTISTHTSQISALNTGLSAKVSQSDFNTLSGRVTTAENNITAKANELSSKISSVEGKIPSGETNLVEYGRPANGYSPYPGAEYTTHGFYYNGAFKMYIIRNKTTSEKTFGMNRFKVERNTEYTLYFKGFNNWLVSNMDVWFLKRVNGSKNDYDSAQQLVSGRKLSNGAAENISVTFNTGNYDEGYLRFDNNGTTNAGEQADLYFGDVSVKKGRSNNGWSPSWSELATSQDLKNAQSEFKQTTDSIKASVSSLDKSTVKSSSLTINSDGIVMKAGKSTTDVANAIGSYFAVNQNAINLFSDKINVKGNMIVNGAITGDKIAANSISSSNIVSSGITANVIKGGTLQSLNGSTNFELDTGKLFYNNNNTGVFRVQNGASTMGLKFSNTSLTVNGTSRILSRTILGGDRRETTLDDGKWDKGGFSGLVIETIKGVEPATNEHADALRAISDTIYFTHTYSADSPTGVSAHGWKMETYAPNSSYSGNIVLKPYGINYRQSDIVVGDVRLDNGDGSGYWMRATINVLKACFGHILNGGTSSQALNAIRSELNKISGT